MKQETYPLDSQEKPAKIIYDMETMCILHDQFGLSYAALARAFQCSRENIRQKYAQKNTKKRTRHNGAWLQPLHNEEIDIIVGFLKSLTVVVHTEDIHFQLLANKNNYQEKAILFKHHDVIKCVFSIPEEISTVLEESPLHLYRYEQIVFNDTLYDWWKNGEALYKDGKRLVLLSTHAKRRRVSDIAKLSGLRIDEYLDSFGYIRIDGRFVQDEEVLSRIKKYADENNNLKITHFDPDYFFFSSRANRTGFTLFDFFKNYGYLYQNENSTADPTGKHKEMMQRYIVTGSTVYIPSEDPFYRMLSGVCYNRHISIDDYCESLGYSRIACKKDLPEEYTPFDSASLQPPVVLTEKEESDHIKAALQEIARIETTYRVKSKASRSKKRNVKLVSQLKKLYHGHCQLCDPSNPLIPPIVKNNGDIYCEVHHIQSFNTATEHNIEQIDHAQNALVVCPFHHRFLHYHHGGYRRLFKTDEGLFIANNHDETAPIYLNHHL